MTNISMGKFGLGGVVAHRRQRPPACAIATFGLVMLLGLLLNIPSTRHFNVLNIEHWHGWPLTYLVRESGGASVWRIDEGIVLFRPVALLINILVFLLAATVTALVYRRWFRTTRFRTFTLQQGFVVLTLAAVVLGIAVHKKERADALRNEIVAMGGQVQMEPNVPDWCRDLFGDEAFRIFDRVTAIVIFDGSLDDSDLMRIGSASSAEAVGLYRCGVDDQEVGQLSHLSKLRLLGLNGNPISGHGLAKLSNLRQLRMLGVSDTHLSESDLVVLRKFYGLRFVQIDASFSDSEVLLNLRHNNPQLHFEHAELPLGP